jgi:hypothetical protein
MNWWKKSIGKLFWIIMFNLKQELKTISSELLTWHNLLIELNEIAWRCRKDLAPGINSRELFEIAFEKGLIKEAYPSDQYGSYYVVVT